MRTTLAFLLISIALTATVFSAYQFSQSNAEANAFPEIIGDAASSSVPGGDANAQLYGTSTSGIDGALPLTGQQGGKTVSYIVVELKNVTIKDDHDELGGKGEIEINTIAMSGKGVPHTLTWPIKVQDSSWYEADDGDVITVNAPIFSDPIWKFIVVYGCYYNG